MRQFTFPCAVLLLMTLAAPVGVRASDGALEPARAVAGDDLAQARELATTGHRAEAIRLLEDRLASHPGDNDATLYLGIILSWEGRYDEARTLLKRVLKQRPTDGDALLGLTNVERWSGHTAAALRVATDGLQLRPKDVNLLLARAQALDSLERPRDAVATVDRALRLEPGNAQAHKMRSSLADELRHWQAGVSQSFDWFNGDRVGWKETSFAVKRATNAGSVVVRASRADRFGGQDNQFEVEFYPRIRPGTYAYVELGWSPQHELYPSYRVNADLYHNFGHGIEVAAGIRRLVFSHPIMLYLVTATKYYGNYSFSGRIYLRPETPDVPGASRSYHFWARRFWGTADDYIGVRVSRGASREEMRGINDADITNSRGIYAEFSKFVARRWGMTINAGYSRDDRPGWTDLKDYSATWALKFRF
jgi:YaiO family outer membrane protein